MSMLAGPRIKQKFSSDPRGNAWSNDNSKFGQKLLEKFGWKKGKGLGANEDGNVDHVTVALKSDNRGVGCSKSHADNWIAHQDDFNSLLASLNQTNNVDDGQETQKPIGLEAKSKSSKSRVHYQKFTKGKDLSGKSSEDLDCIFGKRKSQSENSTPQLSDESSTEDTDDASHGVVTVRSTDSVQDYFAKKMSKIKTASGNLTSSLVAETTSCDIDIPEGDSQTEQRVNFSVGDSDNDEEIKEIKKCKDTKKRKIGKSEDCLDGSVKKKVRFSADTVGGASDTEVKDKKIKKRKKKKHSSEKETNSDEDESVKGQFKKKKTKKDAQVIVEMTEGSELTGKTKEKNRKRKIRETENTESDDKEDLSEEVKDVEVKSSVGKCKKKSSQKTGMEETQKKGTEETRKKGTKERQKIGTEETQKKGTEETQKNKSSGKKKKKKKKSGKITPEVVEIDGFFDNDMKDKLIKEKKSQKIKEISQNKKAVKLPPEINNSCNAFPGCNLGQVTGYAYSDAIMKKAILKQKGKLNKNQNYNRRKFNRW